MGSPDMLLPSSWLWASLPTQADSAAAGHRSVVWPPCMAKSSRCAVFHTVHEDRDTGSAAQAAASLPIPTFRSREAPIDDSFRELCAAGKPGAKSNGPGLPVVMSVVGASALGGCWIFPVCVYLVRSPLEAVYDACSI
ncbi:hypothetical protein COO60DRAFT_58574 [Scenedesmus sp. NREL 46B-D3]|nr:hypothetical protein COO60DRAFT_58574 [Scenedesmus sp. NREL 46B-D3]